MAEIAVMVIDPGANRFAQLVDDATPVRNLIPTLVGRLGLPSKLSYQLIPAGASEGFQIDQSLARLGVRAGAQLHLVPVRDNIFAAVTRKLYDEARDYASKKLWELARQKLDQLFRTNPDQPDPAGLLNIVPGYATGSPVPAPPPGAAGGTVAPAAPPRPDPQLSPDYRPASRGGNPVGCLVLATIIGVVGYVYRVEIENWWKNDRPEWTKNILKGGKDKDAQDAYGLWVGGQYNEVIVGRLSVIMDTPTPQLNGWGLDNAKKVKDTGATFKMVLGPFKTADEARKAYDESLIAGTVRERPFASGTVAKFKFDNQEHPIDNATRLLR